MSKSRIWSSDVPAAGSLRYETSSRHSGYRGLSRAERLEIISLVAAAGASECSAWILPMLEHDDFGDDPAAEKPKC